MILKICVGSSCHLKGSYDVIEHMQSILKKYNVEDLIELQASFCLGACEKGVTVKMEGDETLLIHHMNSENAEELFVQHIYPLLKLN